MLKGVGQYTEGWGSTQRGGAVHKGVGQYTKGWDSTQRGGAVHRGVGQYTYASTSFRSQLYHDTIAVVDSMSG